MRSFLLLPLLLVALLPTQSPAAAQDPVYPNPMVTNCADMAEISRRSTFAYAPYVITARLIRLRDRPDERPTMCLKDDSGSIVILSLHNHTKGLQLGDLVRATGTILHYANGLTVTKALDHAGGVLAYNVTFDKDTFSAADFGEKMAALTGGTPAKRPYVQSYPIVTSSPSFAARSVGGSSALIFSTGQLRYLMPRCVK